MAATALIDPPPVVDQDDEDPVLPKRRKMKADDEMDITPMIDMTFLLLIYFLVASTIDTQNQAELPEARYGRGVSQTTAIVITIGDDGTGRGQVYLADGKQGDPLTGDEETQAAKIREAVEEGMRTGKSSVVLKAERGLTWEEVSRVANAVGEVEGARIHDAVFEKD